MATTKNPVIYITHDSIWIYDPKQKGNNIFQTDWDGGDLTPHFKKIAKHFSVKTAAFLLGQRLSAVAGFEVASDSLNREHILQQTQHVLGASIDDHTFDWKVVDQNPETKAPIVQVATTPTAVLNNLSLAAKEAGITPKTIKPIAVLIAESTSAVPALHLALWNKQEAVGVIAFQGVAYFAAALNPQAYTNDIEQMLENAYQKFTFEINNVVIDWHHRTDQELTQAPEAPENWQKHTVIIDPLERLAADSPAKSDQDLLSFSVIETATKPMPLPKHIVEAPSKPAKPWLKIISITVLVAGLVIALIMGGLYMSRSATTTQQTQALPTPTPLPTIAPSPTPEPLDVSTLKVEILNGSGIPGEAGKVQALLEAAEFVEANLDTGNADSYEYAMTELRAKPELRSRVESLMESVLGTTYILRYEEDLPESSEFDLQIVVGEQKVKTTNPAATPTSEPTAEEDAEESE